MTDSLAKLGAAVEKQRGVLASSKALLAGFTAYVKLHAGEKEVLLAWVAEVDANSDALAADVAANPLPTDGTPA